MVFMKPLAEIEKSLDDQLWELITHPPHVLYIRLEHKCYPSLDPDHFAHMAAGTSGTLNRSCGTDFPMRGSGQSPRSSPAHRQADPCSSIRSWSAESHRIPDPVHLKQARDFTSQFGTSLALQLWSSEYPPQHMLDAAVHRIIERTFPTVRDW